MTFNKKKYLKFVRTLIPEQMETTKGYMYGPEHNFIPTNSML